MSALQGLLIKERNETNLVAIICKNATDVLRNLLQCFTIHYFTIGTISQEKRMTHVLQGPFVKLPSEL